jgi:8-amino-7-oxononanoate synthase
MKFYDRLTQDLETLRAAGSFRTVRQLPKHVINLSGNDYLGLLHHAELRESFYASLSEENSLLSAASSRLLTGNVSAADALETALAEAYGTEAALVFGSGYHANTGILPALVGPKTLILSDKLNHASIIDGIRATGATFYRFRHNDLAHARTYLERYAADYDEVIVVTESVFSMDGDCTDLKALVQLKADFPNVLLYLDEAHGVGVFGETGLGLAQAQGVHQSIDILVGTFGKAWCSTGAFVACSHVIRDTLINKMRPFIFTTALPPINLAWTLHVLRALPAMQARRQHLLSMGKRLADTIRAQGVECVSASQIVPYVIGSNEEAIAAAQRFQTAGFYVLPIRPPTVPRGTARLRFSLSADLSEENFERLLTLFQK